MEHVEHKIGQDSPNEEAMDLRMKPWHTAQSAFMTNSGASTSGGFSVDGTAFNQKLKRKAGNLFKKHKLNKYRYLGLANRSKHTSDSGNFGSSSMMGSSRSSTTESTKKRSSDGSTSSSCTSSSPSSGDSQSPQNLTDLPHMHSADQNMCMMLGQAIPLVVMIQGRMRNTDNCNSDVSCSNTMLFRCNMCKMFANNLTDVLNHVNSTHGDIHYCFVCHQFHSNKSDYDQHMSVCNTAQRAFRQMLGNGCQGNRSTNRPTGHANKEDHALNLTVVENVAMRAAQMVHSKRGKCRKKRIKNLQKCAYCKKAFFGRFYLQRHLRSHTGEKPCHCSICGKGFAEWRNLKNHMKRFHDGSESISSGSRQSKSVSPNITSDSDQRSAPDRVSVRKYPTVQQGINELENLSSQTYSPNSSISRSSSTKDTVTQSNMVSNSNALGTSYSVADFNIPPFKSAYSRSTSLDTFTTSTLTSTLTSAAAYNYRSASSDMNTATGGAPQRVHKNPTNEDVLGNKDIKPLTTYLGSTSSRLELSSEHQPHEQSLKPVCKENGEKVFQCSMCSKVFKTKFAMQRHLDFHADKRPYECDQCEYKAKTRPQLKVHVMRHSGKKGFTCDICNYSCVTHSDLNRHRKSRSHLFRANLLERRRDGAPGPAFNTVDKDLETNDFQQHASESNQH